MSGGGHSDVKNAIWMRALLMAGLILGLGLATYVGLGVVVAGMKETTWDDEAAHAHAAEEVWENAVANGEIASDDEDAELFIAKDEAHHHEVEAHLSYLTYRVSGLTLLFVSITFAAFLAISGILNSAQPDEEHHDDHHGHEEHHGSASPIIFAFGIMLFLIGFPDFADGLHSLMMGSGADGISDLSVSMIGLTIITIGISNWWREDLPFKGYGEQIASSEPFTGQHIRKAGIWVFLMSEVMVFATFFSSYLRMRTEWCTKWALDEGNCTLDSGETVAMTASDYLRPGGAAGTGDFWTLLPGAVNTFALIISSYTIVLALKIAKSHDYKVPSGFMGKIMPNKKSAIRNYLIITLALGTMFIVLKLVEWSHLIAEGFTIGSEQGSIFYVATGAHGLHVFAGLLIMLYMIFKADTVEWDEDNAQGIEYFGLYWHFVDLAWVVIFPAFYLY